MVMMTTNSAESFDLNGIFAKLAREDLQRAVDLAHSFEGESPRAIATLAIARTVLDKATATAPGVSRVADNLRRVPLCRPGAA